MVAVRAREHDKPVALLKVIRYGALDGEGELLRAERLADPLCPLREVVLLVLRRRRRPRSADRAWFDGRRLGSRLRLRVAVRSTGIFATANLWLGNRDADDETDHKRDPDRRPPRERIAAHEGEPREERAVDGEHHAGGQS